METNFLYSIFPDEDVLCGLHPEELAWVILEHLNSMVASERKVYLRKNVFCAEIGIKGYPQKSHEKIKFSLAEAWGFLERELLIIEIPGDLQGGSFFITSIGQEVKNKIDFDTFRKSNLIRRELLHPSIYQKIWGPFLRGEYDISIFTAFREVEVAVRTAGNYYENDIGVNLMRKAFNKNDGNLTDYSLLEQEREAMAHLFAGAIGLYKNPQSHRIVNLGDVYEIVSLLYFSSQLLYIVDRAKKSFVNP